MVLAPSVLAVFGSSAVSTWPDIFITTGVIAVMLVIAVIGIRPTARTQVARFVLRSAFFHLPRESAPREPQG